MTNEKTEMSEFGVWGEIVSEKVADNGGRDVKWVVFTVEADDREDAKFLFYHGVHLPEIPKGYKFNRLDMRTLYKIKAHKSEEKN